MREFLMKFLSRGRPWAGAAGRTPATRAGRQRVEITIEREIVSVSTAGGALTTGAELCPACGQPLLNCSAASHRAAAETTLQSERLLPPDSNS
jgi:hypothetical protein